ncbi:hypothetical protein Q7P35_010492 [Cladosporium inversicolor]
MGNEDKHIDTDAERQEHRISIEKDAANLDSVPGSDAAQKALFLEFASKDEDWKKEMDKKLVRKIDLRLLPILVVLYLLNFLDRANLSQARQGDLERDLDMHGSDFNLATSIFFVGYLIMQLPSNLLITRLPPSIYLSVAATVWGVVSTCNGAVQSFGQLIAVRLILGFVECPFFPGAIFLMSSWYTRAELTKRISWFYSGNALANMFGGLLAAGILGNLDGSMGIAGWRWLFIIEGVITIGVAIAAGFILPDYPATTKWLNEEERNFASWRLMADISESDDTHSRSIWEGVKLCLTDYRLYLFVLTQHMSILSQTFQYFFPSIVQTLGYGEIETLLLTVPVWFATFLVSIAVTWSAGTTGDRSLHICVLMLFAVAGNAIVAGTTVVGARYFAMFLMPMGAVSAYQIIVSWVANSFPRPLVKRSSAIAIGNCVANAASIYGSYMYPSSDGPRYIPGSGANAAICLSIICLALVLRYVHKWENKKLERAEQEAMSGESAGGDVRGVGFRYVY